MQETFNAFLRPTDPQLSECHCPLGCSAAVFTRRKIFPDLPKLYVIIGQHYEGKKIQRVCAHRTSGTKSQHREVFLPNNDLLRQVLCELQLTMPLLGRMPQGVPLLRNTSRSEA